jgi:hypothetical protein
MTGLVMKERDQRAAENCIWVREALQRRDPEFARQLRALERQLEVLLDTGTRVRDSQ